MFQPILHISVNHHKSRCPPPHVQGCPGLSTRVRRWGRGALFSERPSQSRRRRHHLALDTLGQRQLWGPSRGWDMSIVSWSGWAPQDLRQPRTPWPPQAAGLRVLGWTAPMRVHPHGDPEGWTWTLHPMSRVAQGCPPGSADGGEEPYSASGRLSRADGATSPSSAVPVLVAAALAALASLAALVQT